MTVVIEHTDGRDAEVLQFATAAEAREYVETYYSDCVIEESESMIEVTY